MCNETFTWNDFEDVEVFIEKKSFAKGAFRETFKANSSNNL